MANTFQYPLPEQKACTLLQMQLLKNCVMVILNRKFKSTRDNQILTNAILIGKDQLKIGIRVLKMGVRELKVANIDNNLVYLTATLTKWLPDAVINSSSLITSDLAIILLNFSQLSQSQSMQYQYHYFLASVYRNVTFFSPIKVHDILN